MSSLTHIKVIPPMEPSGTVVSHNSPAESLNKNEKSKQRMLLPGDPPAFSWFYNLTKNRSGVWALPTPSKFMLLSGDKVTFGT